MPKLGEPWLPQGTVAAPVPAAAAASTKASPPPQAHPPPNPGGAAPKGLPPNAVLIKVSKPLTSHPSSNFTSASSSSPALTPASGSTAKEAAVGPPTPVPVPAQSWYGNPFTLSTNTPMSEFHRSMRGKVFFSPRAVPVVASELLSLPGERPPQLTVCEIGKDLLYGVGYLYNTPLSVEHQWRGRVAHLLRVRSNQAPIPNIVRRRAEAVAASQQKQHQLQQQKGGGTREVRPSEKSKTPASPSPAPQEGGAVVPIDYAHTMVYERGEAAVYDRPCDDLLIGIKLYVNEELVEDHYPIVNALPQCTATLAVKEATQHWNCVPFVLMGYLNQLMLEPICIYHALSLNFVEHLLRVKIPASAAPARAPKTAVKAPTPSDAKPVPKKKSPPSVELTLRVEVVYGCRAEAFYCTDFISRGACTLRMRESSKRALKNYEEKLRALVRLRLAAPQLIARSSRCDSPPPLPPRNCSVCGHPLQYQCTVCGADVCGMPMCVATTVVGYPRACTKHALPLNKPG
ncbi:hypothetical protein ABB37_01632 [Leptomonas pyrrhocoris]|uniref:Uncharacterized protein n=1 Tax=Leptomonas pyrrhocoris TaxID=157538 RepID=A0A0N0DZH1_LEPPY|nr:hypothetical protein ABB37_01632 [Leptomonas pyrrhocoris]KPA85295.1 hypothetical protein ABB37_01632 [Leptomonas pyrrhocoris]|eukprot:XP_015663734.1 hypothetical protein ABB37_01632 [Leptomonas pyrrhocoris]